MMPNRRVLLCFAIVYLAVTAHLLPFWTSNGALWGRVVTLNPSLPSAIYHTAVAELGADPQRALLDFRRVRTLSKTRADLPVSDVRFWLTMADQMLAVLALQSQAESDAGYLLNEAYEVYPETFERPVVGNVAPSPTPTWTVRK